VLDNAGSWQGTAFPFGPEKAANMNCAAFVRGHMWML
jgi:hypothetical protein